MSEAQRIAVVLVTHGGYGRALVRAAEDLVGWLELQTVEIVDLDRPPGEVRAEIEAKTNGGPALLLTDLCGSTPANICLALASERGDREVLTGVNLPMLIRLATGERGDRQQTIGDRLARLTRQLQQSARRSVRRGDEMVAGTPGDDGHSGGVV